MSKVLRTPTYLIGTSIVVTTAILQGNTPSPIVVEALITGAPLSTSGGAGYGVSQTRTRRGTSFRADLVVTVFGTFNSYKKAD